MQNWTNAKLCDVANLILGAFLFVSPWIFGFGAGMTSQNAAVAGIVVAALAIAALAAFAVWEEWLNLIVGLQTSTTAMIVHVVIGILVAALAVIELWMTQNLPRLTTGR